VRGVGRVQYVESLKAYRVFVMVYGKEADEASISLEIYDPVLKETFTLDPVAFTADATRGTPAEPVLLGAMTDAYRAAQEAQALPTTYTLSQNYPNPFNPETVIQYQVAQPTAVKIDIFNIRGQKVHTLVNELQPAGTYNAVWRGVNDAGLPVATGVYIYRMRAGEFVSVRKMLFLK